MLLPIQSCPPFKKTLNCFNQKPAIIILTRLVYSDIALLVESTAKPYTVFHPHICESVKCISGKNCLLPKDNFLKKILHARRNITFT